MKASDPALSRALASATEATGGASSSAMVTLRLAGVPSVAPLGEESATVNASSGSSSASSATATVNVVLVWPAVIVTV